MEINVTLRCNADCQWCNRLLDRRQFTDSDMSITQAEAFVDELQRRHISIKRLKVSGGEPTILPHLSALLQIFSQSANIAKIVVQTNGIHKINLPPDCRYKVSTLKRKRHMPHLISPTDIGIEWQYGVEQPCRVQRRCGRGWEAWGFTSCPVGGTYGRLVGINPYTDTYQHKGNPDICKHCIYSVEPAVQLALRTAAMNGYLQSPTKTLQHETQFTIARWREVTT